MSENQSRPATDPLVLTANTLQGVKSASADYCAKLATLQDANQRVPNPVGVQMSLLPRAIKEAKKDAARCVREFEEIVADAPSVAHEAVSILRKFERRAKATQKAGAGLVKSFGERVEKDRDAVEKVAELKEELQSARDAVVRLECMLGAAAAPVLNAFEAVTHSLERLAVGGWGSGGEATPKD